MMDTRETEVRTPRIRPPNEELRLLANFAHGSPSRSHDRGLGFPLQHFFIEYLERNGWETSDSTLHVVPMVVGTIMLPWGDKERSTISRLDENRGAVEGQRRTLVLCRVKGN